MAEVNRRGGLGRGLAALIPPGSEDGPQLQEIPLSAVVPNPRQPRGVFDEDELEGLAQSIRDVGVLQPIVVRPVEGDRFELIAGERRLRASKLAGLTKVPALLRGTEDGDLLKEALIENIHRVQLNPLEEGAAYQQLLDDFGATHEELARRLGKSRPTITNALRLLSLPPAVQRKVAAGVLSAGHAKALAAIEDRGQQEHLADRIVAEGLSVRATEEVVRLRYLDEDDAGPGSTGNIRGGGSSGTATRKMTAPGIAALQEDLTDALRTRVKISRGARKGNIRIEFGSVDDLERIVGVIAAGLQTDLSVDS